LFYLEIDQHAKQLTISQRDLSGDVAQRRQVSAEPVGLLGGVSYSNHSRHSFQGSLGGGNLRTNPNMLSEGAILHRNHCEVVHGLGLTFLLSTS